MRNSQHNGGGFLRLHLFYKLGSRGAKRLIPHFSLQGSAGDMYTDEHQDQSIVWKRFSSHFVNQPERVGLPSTARKWLKTRAFAANMQLHWLPTSAERRSSAATYPISADSALQGAGFSRASP
jgi:hypothetical protein